MDINQITFTCATWSLYDV